MLNGLSILVTGGTGSLGSALIKLLIKQNPQKIICYSRDEFKQVTLRREIGEHKVRFFIGDVRDRSRLYRALNGVDYVIHCAAMKNIDATEYNPCETLKTNTIGAMNLVDAAIDCGVERVLGISTDKAVNPISLYGAAKLCADKLFLASNNYAGTKFSVIRFGNFEGSRGSVIPFFEALKAAGATEIPITDFRMTRFWIDIDDAAKRSLQALLMMNGGEVFSPKMRQESVTDLASRICPGMAQKEIGIRIGEKLHEELVLPIEAAKTIETDDFFVTYWGDPPNEKRVPDGFYYSSQ